MKQHRIDTLSLVFGLIFVGLAGWWALDTYTNLNLDVPNLGWFLAAGLIVLGLLGVVASLRRPAQPESLPESLPEPTPVAADPVDLAESVDADPFTSTDRISPVDKP